MLLCAIKRTHLLHLLPKGGEGAEIGVAKGEFSRPLLDTLEPSRLHLIDPWSHQDRDDYAHDANNADADEQERRYRDVCGQFAAEIETGRVVVHRAYSQDVARSFADGQLDWVYIDGLHSYEGCRSDLQHYKSKVKPDGLIFGHDYTNHVAARQMDFGVVEAVNEFVIEEGFTFIALTQEVFPTYVLTRNPDSAAAQTLRAGLIYHLPAVVEMRDYPAKGVFLHQFVQVGDQQKAVVSF
ncbi:MAG TPA: class I SAM-dependent methyltransferase [Stellaceae bacterium]|jgi:hypothetical protein